MSDVVFVWSYADAATSLQEVLDAIEAGISGRLRSVGWDVFPVTGAAFTRVSFEVRNGSGTVYRFALFSSGGIRGGGQVSTADGPETAVILTAVGRMLGFDLVRDDTSPYQPDFDALPPGEARSLAELLGLARRRIDVSQAKPVRRYYV